MTPFQDLLKKEVGYTQTEMGFDITRFQCSSVTEFVDSLKILDKSKRFPFVFLNSQTVEMATENADDNIVTVGEIVIATASLDSERKYSSEEKDTKVFNVFLNPFLEKFLFRLQYSANIAVYKKGKITRHYQYGNDTKNGVSGEILDSSACAIKLTNFQFRILTIKNN